MKNQHSNRARRGAVLPFVLFLIIALLAVAALSINSNWLLIHQVNSQVTADLSARSALSKVQVDSDPGPRIKRAKKYGADLFSLNYYRPNATISEDQIKLGSLEPSTDGSDSIFVQNEANGARVTAVHVDPPVSNVQNDVNVFLSGFLGHKETVEVTAESTASTGAVDIVLCLDASGSMNLLPESRNYPPGGSSVHEPPLPGSRWFAMLDVVGPFIESVKETNPNARVALVTFGGGLTGRKIYTPIDEFYARREVPLTLVSSNDIEKISQTLDEYSDLPALGYGTSIYDGIAESLKDFDDPAASRHIILLSDGSQAIRDQRPDELVAAQDAVDNGVFIHAISFGDTIRSLGIIAEMTGGANFTALSQEELDDSFRQLLSTFRVRLVK